MKNSKETEILKQQTRDAARQLEALGYSTKFSRREKRAVQRKANKLKNARAK